GGCSDTKVSATNRSRLLVSPVVRVGHDHSNTLTGSNVPRLAAVSSLSGSDRIVQGFSWKWSKKSSCGATTHWLPDPSTSRNCFTSLLSGNKPASRTQYVPAVSRAARQRRVARLPPRCREK